MHTQTIFLYSKTLGGLRLLRERLLQNFYSKNTETVIYYQRSGRPVRNAKARGEGCKFNRETVAGPIGKDGSYGKGRRAS